MKVLLNNSEKNALLNSKYYFGFGYSQSGYQCYVSESLEDVSVSGTKSTVSTVINCYIPDGQGKLQISRYTITTSDMSEKIFYKHSTKDRLIWGCPIVNKTVWKYKCGFFSMYEAKFVYPSTLYFAHLKDCLQFYCEPSYIRKASRYSGDSPPSLQDLSSFIIINSCFPFFHTLRTYFLLHCLPIYPKHILERQNTCLIFITMN